jgi:PPOX class probable F420-dependent enzyme
VSEAGQPHIVPITFAQQGDRIFCAVDAKPKSTRQLARLRNIRENPRVAVLADHYAEDWSLLWWARADGRAEILTGQQSMAAPIRLLADRYAQYTQQPPAGPVISIAVGRWTGWAAS